MPVSKKYLADFHEGNYYHVYNRTNNKEKLFLSGENHRFFIQKYEQIMLPFIDTFCWCLLPNHFHFLIRIKPITEIRKHLQNKYPCDITETEKKFLSGQKTISELIEQSFRRFFVAYATSFNSKFSRKGNLFFKPFKRVLVDDGDQLITTVVYIHTNPVKHELINDFRKYEWSSWHKLVSEFPKTVKEKEMIGWFGNKKLFIETHLKTKQY
jgi:putative transposase